MVPRSDYSVNYCERGAAWANLARGILRWTEYLGVIRSSKAALMLDEEELDELLEQLTDGLA